MAGAVFAVAGVSHGLSEINSGCALGKVLKIGASGVECGDDLQGSAGSFQAKITNGLTACSGANLSIKTINPDTGAIACETDDSGAAGQWVTGAGGIIYYNGGNAGIGTSTPDKKLTVAGGAREVGIWDNLTVNGKITSTGDICTATKCLNSVGGGSTDWASVINRPWFSTDLATNRVKMINVGCGSGYNSSCDAAGNGYADYSDTTGNADTIGGAHLSGWNSGCGGGDCVARTNPNGWVLNSFNAVNADTLDGKHANNVCSVANCNWFNGSWNDAGGGTTWADLIMVCPSTYPIMTGYTFHGPRPLGTAEMSAIWYKDTTINRVYCCQLVCG